MKVEEIKLAFENNQKFELATIYDNIKQTIIDANKDHIQSLDYVSKASKLSKNSLDKNRALLKEIEKAEILLKDLGLDSEIKKVQDAKNLVNSNISAIDKTISNLLSI